MCAENKIAYKKPDHEDVVTLIPRRDGMPLDQPLLITGPTGALLADMSAGL